MMKSMGIMLCILVPAYSVAIETTFLYEQDSSLLNQYIDVTVLSGVNAELPDKAGLANLTSELMLRGTKKRTRSEFNTELEKMGAVISAQVGADFIHFKGAVVKENLQAFLILFQDFIINPKFSEKDLSLLKKELLESIKSQKNQNSRLAGLALRQQMFTNTPFEFPNHGTVKSVTKIGLGDIRTFYNNSFRQANMIFSSAGPTPENVIKEHLARIGSQLPNGEGVTLKSVTPIKPEKTEIIVVKKENTATGTIILGQPGIIAGDPNRFALALGDFAFGSEPMISRLFKTIRADKGWTYSIYSSYEALGGLSTQTGGYLILETPLIEHTASSIFEVLNMWGTYLKDGIDKSELRIARESSVKAHPFTMETANQRLAERLNSKIYGVPYLSDEQFEETLEDISLSDIKKALVKQHASNPWWIIFVGDPVNLQKQLDEAQKNIPLANKISISKIVTPSELIQENK